MLFTFLDTTISPVLSEFARGGGGGSGGSDGGDGGGIFVLLGYLPMHWLGATLRKHGSSNVVASAMQQIVGWVIAIVYSAMWVFIWGGMGALIGIAALVGMGAGLYNWFSKIKQSKLVSANLKQAAATDAAWDETKLTTFATETFNKYQADWSAFRTEAMQSYVTPRYHHHVALLMYTLQLMKRQNVMSNVAVAETGLIAMNDSADNTQDSFSVGITAKAQDQLIDTGDSNRLLFTDNGTFTEYWHFVRSGQTWLLDGITQQTASPFTNNPAMQTFAQSQGYYYSEDMGWLFIPKRGQLFGQGKFGTSDINNHIVGLYKNQLLIQMYSYVANPTNSVKPIVIAQVNVPKSYGQIVVRRKKLLQLGIKGLERVETEWTKFNDKYEVFAESYEQATSFELLEPTYMEQLEALPFEVNIEVVDNVIYLYTDEGKSDVTTYQTLLELTNKAFDQMKL